MAKSCHTISAIVPENNRRFRTAEVTKFSAKRSGSCNDSSYPPLDMQSVSIGSCKW